MPPRLSAWPPPVDEEQQDGLRCVTGTMVIDGFILTRAEKKLLVRGPKDEIADEALVRIVHEMPAPGEVATGRPSP